MDSEQLKHWSTVSPLVRIRTEAERVFDAEARRALTAEEIHKLELAGNSAEAWEQVRVAEAFDPVRVIGCRFEGTVEIGAFGGEVLPSDGRPGLYHSLLRDCRIEGGVCISRCGRIERVFVGRGALVEGVGRLSVRGRSSNFGNDLELFNEPLYSRAVRAVAELPFEWAVKSTGPDAERKRDHEFETQLRSASGAYAQRMESTTGFVGPGVVLRATPVVENCWVGPGVEIDGAGTLRDSTLWAEEEAPTFVGDGAEIQKSLIGPGCRIGDQSLVRSCLMVEAVQVGDQAIVKRSLIGPNVRLGECEVNDSLLGPFTTALHHSLIIAAWWPEGRGNIGYGANVGSNHTGRAPDQEIWPGEGVFFGLGCNIKLPSNFRRAPYSLIATGTDTLPQRLEFPFSLIAKPGVLPEGRERSLNELRPGWNLANNAYGLERQERNQATRNRATRTPITPGVFRLEFAPLLEEARGRLVDAARDDRETYDASDVPGLGRNFMTEAARRKGVEAYAFGLTLIASHSLLRAVDQLVEDDVPEANWNELERALRFFARLQGNSEPEGLMKACLNIEEEWMERMIESKRRDDHRGSETIDDYAERHVDVDRDPLLAIVRDDLNRRRSEIERSLDLIHQASSRPSGARV